MAANDDLDDLDFETIDSIPYIMGKAAALHGTQWLDQAACADSEVSEFFDTPRALASLEVAKTCISCPVYKECLETIAELETNTKNKGKGVFAGLSPADRSLVYEFPKEDWVEVAKTTVRQFIIYRTSRQPAKEKK